MITCDVKKFKLNYLHCQQKFNSQLEGSLKLLFKSLVLICNLTICSFIKINDYHDIIVTRKHSLSVKLNPCVNQVIKEFIQGEKLLSKKPSILDVTEFMNLSLRFMYNIPP